MRTGYLQFTGKKLKKNQGKWEPRLLQYLKALRSIFCTLAHKALSHLPSPFLQTLPCQQFPLGKIGIVASAPCADSVEALYVISPCHKLHSYAKRKSGMVSVQY